MKTSEQDIRQHILIVDDEPVNLKLLGAHLKRGGYDVLEASGGQAALDKAAATLPDLILLDIMMPGMDGLETCRRLKADAATRDIPVIFLSALSDSEVKTKGLEVGGVDYISKPFDSRELLARVRTHLTLKSQEQQIRSYAENLEDMVRLRTSELSEAQREIQRDFEIQTVIASLLRFSLDTMDLDELLSHTLERILAVRSFSFLPQGCIFLATGTPGAMRLAAHRNLPQELLDQCQGDAPELLQDCHLDEAVLLPEATGDESEAVVEPRLVAPTDRTAHFCLPIRYDQRLLGVMHVYLKQGHSPDSKERAFLSAVSNTLARIILYKQAQTRLMESEEQYRAIFENTGTAMVIIRSDGRIELANSGFEALVGLSKAELEDRHGILDFVHPEDRPAMERQLGDDQSENRGTRELRINGHNGSQRFVTCIQSRIPGAASRVLSLSDITDRKRAEEQVLHHAFHDSLTGLPNRTVLLDRLAQAVERATREPDYTFAVLLMDLDRFNLVNESLGHDIGDQLIIELAERLHGLKRPQDLLVRLGGDEFALLREGFRDESEITDLALHILSVVRQPFTLEGNELVSTSSIGIALSTFAYQRGEEVLRDADTALHRAKQRGKARYEVFDTDMHLKAKSLLSLVTDMRQALERNEYLLHYQPFVDLNSGTVYGFEALVRWLHPTRGMVSPGEFIPEAEESGLIIPIGQWVLREACATMQRLYREQKLPRCLLLSVNLSGKQFAHEDIYEHVRQVLDETGFDPRCLKLEITESAIMEDAAAATAMLRRLKELEVHISIDDFGTGYSSLSYLHRFPVDTLKIDRSFVSTMGSAGENVEIVRTIVALAHNLGLQVIAEGVETAQQVETVRNLGCEYAQGYYFSRPVDQKTLVEQDLFHKRW